MSIGNVPEVLSQQILVGRLGVATEPLAEKARPEKARPADLVRLGLSPSVDAGEVVLVLVVHPRAPMVHRLVGQPQAVGPGSAESRSRLFQGDL